MKARPTLSQAQASGHCLHSRWHRSTEPIMLSGLSRSPMKMTVFFPGLRWHLSCHPFESFSPSPLCPMDFLYRGAPLGLISDSTC